MNTRLSANLSVLGTSLMLILSFSFGFHSYTEAKKTIVTDLNQALQQTILQNSHLWMSQDSIRTYANLSKLFGNPVSIESYIFSSTWTASSSVRVSAASSSSSFSATSV